MTRYRRRSTFSALAASLAAGSGRTLNPIMIALEAAANEPQPSNKVFSPQNWIKTKTCLAGIRAAIRQYINMLPSMPGGKELSVNLKKALEMDPKNFEGRWSAD